MRRRRRPTRAFPQPPIRRRAERRQNRRWAWFASSALLFVASLGAVVRVSAMPAEARTRETWYGYRHEIRYDFAARVRPGPVYARDLVTSVELEQTKLPVDPPVYRRVLVGPMAESLRISLPYTFVADRPGEIHLTYGVDGQIGVPNLWRRPYPLLPTQSRTVRAAEVRLDDLFVEIPIGDLLEEVKAFSEEEKVPFDQLEIRLRPTITVDVDGQREPVAASLSPEFLVQVRNGGVAVEIDEPRTVSDEKQFQVDERVPLTMQLWEYELPVTWVRRMAYLVLIFVTLLIVAGMLPPWIEQRRRRGPAEDLRKLGSGLIRANEFTLPEGVSMVEVTRLEYLVHLHVQTERPVIQVGNVYYLLDGGSCYRCSISG